mgnify:CR=1 FL=1
MHEYDYDDYNVNDTHDYSDYKNPVNDNDTHDLVKTVCGNVIGNINFQFSRINGMDVCYFKKMELPKGQKVKATTKKPPKSIFNPIFCTQYYLICFDLWFCNEKSYKIVTSQGQKTAF